jgi:hypothetical protein
VNPRTFVNSNGKNQRTYATTANAKGRFMLGMDYLDFTQFNPDGTVMIYGQNFAHSRSGGWNVLFSDGSVEFHKISIALRLIYLNGGFRSQYDGGNAGLNQLCTLMEQSN